MASRLSPLFIDNPAVKGREDRYVELAVRPEKILESWRLSLFSFEWLRPDGRIKAIEDLSSAEREKRAKIEVALAGGEALEKPVLGIGMLDNVEIGSGRAVFLTLAAHGIDSVPVHVPEGHAASFRPYMVKDRKSESGNVVYYILAAIVLLAALTAAVASGWRNSITSLSTDKQKLLATEIIGYGDNVAKAVAQLRLRGITLSQIRFSSPSLSATYGTYGAAPDAEIFNPDGGGLHYKAPPDEAMTTPGDYIFTAANAIEQVGTDCAAAGCADLVMMAGPLKTEICMMINTLLNVPNPGSAPPTSSTGDITTLFAGTPSYSATIGDQPGGAALQGKTAACFNKSGDNYFYQVLAPQ